MTDDIDALLEAIDHLDSGDPFPWTDAARWSPGDPHGDLHEGCVCCGYGEPDEDPVIPWDVTPTQRTDKPSQCCSTSPWRNCWRVINRSFR